MSRAEDLARQKYPNDEPIDCVRCHVGVYKREGFVAGYHQAEEDLALTWEDMMLIHKCIKDAMNYHLYKMLEGMEGQMVVYQEVLKRFKERKEK